MDDRLRRQSDLFINNRIAMRKGFLWDYASVQGVASIMWSSYQKEIDVEKIRQCKKALRDEAEVFCYLEDNAFVIAAAMLALSDNPPKMLKRLKKMFKMMLEEGFKPTGPLLLTALILIRFHDESDYPEILRKVKQVCLALKSVPWHMMVSVDEGADTANMLPDKDVKDVIRREKHYKRLLRGEFPSAEIEELIASAMIIDHRSEEQNVMNLLSLYATVKGSSEQDYFKFPADYTVLAMLAMVTKTAEETMSRVFEVYDYLRSQKSLEFLELKSSQYFYYSSMIVAMADVERVRYSKYMLEADGDIFMAVSMLPIMLLVTSRK